jgi:hypothetical protein
MSTWLFLIFQFTPLYRRNPYIAYVNTSLYADGSGVLYDMGVKVGNNTAQGVVKLSSGVDAFLQYMLNPFIWG